MLYLQAWIGDLMVFIQNHAGIDLDAWHTKLAAIVKLKVIRRAARHEEGRSRRKEGGFRGLGFKG